jgi:hypothetical protein
MARCSVKTEKAKCLIHGVKKKKEGRILSRFSSAYTITSCLFKININIIVQSTPRSHKWYVKFDVLFLFTNCLLHATHI